MHSGLADMLLAMADLPSVSAVDEMSKKIRKPYTITKSRESWTEQEHDKFLEALQLFDRDWKKIEAFVGTKSVIQIRSHAQKYFLKVQKNGTGQHVPPPRPKRKSAQPYPQKATKTALVTQEVGGAVMPISQSEPAYSAGLQLWAGIPVFAPGGTAAGLGPMDKNEEDPFSKFQPVCPSISQGSEKTVLRAMPDFAEVYSFIGTIFDSSKDNHLKRMQEMAPIDRETVLLLMRNLSINLSFPDLEEHINLMP